MIPDRKASKNQHLSVFETMLQSYRSLVTGRYREALLPPTRVSGLLAVAPRTVTVAGFPDGGSGGARRVKHGAGALRLAHRHPTETVPGLILGRTGSHTGLDGRWRAGEP